MAPKWPNGARAAIALTLDNMGEAADLNRGLWPSTTPIGNHYSVKTVLPQILTMLDRHSIKATYFTEAWNLDVYPDTIRELGRRGHEVAWHAWQHEAWAKQTDEQERGNFERSFERVAREDGVRKYKGFRPPGGLIKDHTLALCREYGVGYLSPAGHELALVPTEASSSSSSLVILPFKWLTVDAYYYMATFAGLRGLKGEPEPDTPLSPAELTKRYKQEIDAAIQRGGFLSLLFHPFLTEDEHRLQAMEQVLSYLQEKREEGTIWLARCDEIEDWVRGHPEGVGEDPGWDLSAWR